MFNVTKYIKVLGKLHRKYMKSTARKKGDRGPAKILKQDLAIRLSA
jgi:hypothetical protein